MASCIVFSLRHRHCRAACWAARVFVMSKFTAVFVISKQVQSLSARMSPVIKASEMHVHVATVGSRKTGSKPAVQRCHLVIPHVVKAARFNGQRKAVNSSEWLTTKLHLHFTELSALSVISPLT